MAEKKLKITLVKSPIGAVPKNKKTVEALGLRKLNKTVEMPDNEAVRGMIWHVRHLVKVEEIIAPRAFATPHLFGENNILPATFTVSKDSILLMATRTSVFKLISSVPQLLHSFLCVTGNCNECTVTRLRILSYKNLRSRFVYYLMEHRTSAGIALLEHNQVQLADYLGVTRPALSKEINKMIKEGLISVDKREVTLLNMQGLKEYI